MGSESFPNIHLAPINKSNKIVRAGDIQMALAENSGIADKLFDRLDLL